MARVITARQERRSAPSRSSCMGGVRHRAPLFALLALVACRDPAKAVQGEASKIVTLAADAASATGPLGGKRPLDYLLVPASYDAQNPSPLVLVLHGYGSSGAAHAAMFTLGNVPERERVIVAAPDGTLDSAQARFWNAVPSCCDFEEKGVDDVAYLRGLVRELRARYAIDPARIYAVGHSNGGAMALRLACEDAGTFAAVIDLAGPFYADGIGSCHPSEPISVRIMHGTLDGVVPYTGGLVPVRVHPKSGRFPTSSARGKADTFAAVDGCTRTPTAKPAIDVDLAKEGAETDVLAFEGCQRGTAVELWSMNGVGHAPSRPVGWQSAWDFLAAHAKR